MPSSRELELVEMLQAALEWIDAVPSETVASLPAMPGFDRDEVDAKIQEIEEEHDYDCRHHDECRVSIGLPPVE